MVSKSISFQERIIIGLKITIQVTPYIYVTQCHWSSKVQNMVLVFYLSRSFVQHFTKFPEGFHSAQFWAIHSLFLLQWCLKLHRQKMCLNIYADDVMMYTSAANSDKLQQKLHWYVHNIHRIVNGLSWKSWRLTEESSGYWKWRKMQSSKLHQFL